MGSDCTLIAHPVKAIPAPKKIAEIVPVKRGPCLSVIRPIKAAEKPKQKIARLKANEIWLSDQVLAD